MASSNVIAEVVTLCTKAVKSKDSTVQAPSKWAAAAGFSGSAASPLREHIARTSKNGCGREGRYPKVDAAGMLELIALGDQYKAAEGAKKVTLQKRIRSRVRPAAAAGAKAAKTQAGQRKRTKSAA